ncbi:MAG: HflX GTPase family protein, partial [Candidatus Paceibacterales bacterium]
ALHRSRRHQSRVITIALVGYTNAGKSTILNQLTNAKVLAENKLFATLDPTTRKLFLPSGRQAVLTDTVGFINNLPLHLVEAFKATFEEIAEADFVLHVHDASHPSQKQHADTVTKMLEELGVNSACILNVYNKCDLLQGTSESNRFRINPFVNVSALTGEGLDGLISAIEERLKQMVKPVDLYLPATDPGLVFKLARDGKILNQEQGEHIIHCRVELSEEALQRWSKYLQDHSVL